MGAYKNLFKGIGIIFAICIAALLGLYRSAIGMNAGTTGFNVSAGILALEILAIALCYIVWYIKVDHRAADLLDTKAMKKAAARLMVRYAVISLIVTVIIGMAALVIMLFDILRIGIPAIYSYSSVGTMLVVGNLVLVLLMKFNQPNRLTGTY